MGYLLWWVWLLAFLCGGSVGSPSISLRGGSTEREKEGDNLVLDSATSLEDVGDLMIEREMKGEDNDYANVELNVLLSPLLVEETGNFDGVPLAELVDEAGGQPSEISETSEAKGMFNSILKELAESLGTDELNDEGEPFGNLGSEEREKVETRNTERNKESNKRNEEKHREKNEEKLTKKNAKNMGALLQMKQKPVLAEMTMAVNQLSPHALSFLQSLAQYSEPKIPKETKTEELIHPSLVALSQQLGVESVGRQRGSYENAFKANRRRNRSALGAF